MSSRLVRTSLRTAHLIAIAACYGGHVFDVDPSRLTPTTVGVLLTGGAFMLFEASRSPIWLVQVRGAATLAKVALFIFALTLPWEPRVAVLTLLIAIGTFVSHMQAKYRYYSLAHRQVIHSDGRG